MLLRVRNLSVSFHDTEKAQEVLREFHITMMPGEIVGVVGESGSGKTTAALAVMGLLKRHASIEKGSVFLEDTDLLKCSRSELRQIQGDKMAMIFQEPMVSLNPTMRIGKQVEEALHIHTAMDASSIREKAREALCDAELDPDEVYEKYPHELSGGMRQRVMIASAIVTRPKLLLADEPTTALDEATQGQILALLKKTSRKLGMGILFISHDLSAVHGFTDRVIVMKEGRITEEGDTENIFLHPADEYTKSLLNAYPEHTSCVAKDAKPVLTVNGLSTWYEGKQVLDNVSFSVYENEILGLVGRSGSGKSTLARSILGFVKKTSGVVSHYTKMPQMVFQDPYSSLNPCRRIGWTLEEPLRIKGGVTREERREAVGRSLLMVGLGEEYADRYPDQLSGGQRQRVSIALALILESKFIIIDEGLSSLDMTIQGQIMRLLDSLHKERGLSYLYISHDLKAVSHMCDRVLLMRDGKITEAPENTGGSYDNFI